MNGGGTRRTRALIMSGIVATAVVVGGAIPAPGQVPDEGPEVDYVDAFGPVVYGYEDCDGVVHTEADLTAGAYVELEDEVEADVEVALSYGGELAALLVDAPAAITIPAGESWSFELFTLDELVEGSFTVTAEPGVGYTAGPEDTYTVEVTDDVEVIGSCSDDLGNPPDGTDRQTIEVGERPLPLGFYVDEDALPEPEPTVPAPPTSVSTTSTSTTTTTEATTTTTEATTTTTEGTTTTTEGPSQGFPATQSRGRTPRVVPDGWDTPVANGSLPPGLTYVDDVWSGAATTPGTYRFDVRLCYAQSALTLEAGRTGGARRPAPRAFPDTICLGAVDVVVQVLAADRPSALPAEPLDAAADFAG